MILTVSVFTILCTSVFTSYDLVPLIAFAEMPESDIVSQQKQEFTIGTIQWKGTVFQSSEIGGVYVIDPDMNLNPNERDSFTINVWSEYDPTPIEIVVNEIGNNRGTFKGLMFFSDGNDDDSTFYQKVKVNEFDTVIASYVDITLPSTHDRFNKLEITEKTKIATPLSPPCKFRGCSDVGLRIVDAFGNDLYAVSVGESMQFPSYFGNGEYDEQQFAYVVQVKNDDGVVVNLQWITGSLSSGQSFSPAISWIPTQAGTYTATAFVWESVRGGITLGSPLSVTFDIGK